MSAEIVPLGGRGVVSQSFGMVSPASSAAFPGQIGTLSEKSVGGSRIGNAATGVAATITGITREAVTLLSGEPPEARMNRLRRRLEEIDAAWTHSGEVIVVDTNKLTIDVLKFRGRIVWESPV